MRVRFVRTRGEADRIYVRRSDGSEASWSFPTYGDGLPHDLVHLVVESAFAIRNGFWGRVDSGVDVARINAEASRKGGPDKYAGFGEDRRELMLAETLAGIAWSVVVMSPVERWDYLLDACRELELELPDRITSEGLEQVRHKLAELGREWRAFGPKGTIELSFNPEELS